ncbi:MAG: ABC transporter substrate-binding protein [Hyphomicrobiaceae bacterium]|nr:ABC transporter substrate-binding protein [Hyphomicrobiaceae bacterium]
MTAGATTRRSILAGTALAAAALGLAAFAGAARAEGGPDLSDFAAIEAAARGQTVYFHAWSGAPNINAYIEWVGDVVEERYGIELVHVPVTDTANVVGIIVAEDAAGRREGGSVDLVWINGENFVALKRAGLLLAPDGEGWAQRLPSYAFVDTEGNPTTTIDFTEPTEGLEAPWGTVQLSFYYDSAEGLERPADVEALAAFIEANPGRFTYPQPPNFLGTTFLKQVLAGLIDDPQRLQAPLAPEDAAEALAPLFAWLDRVHPHLWRSGRAFPADQVAMAQLFSDSEIAIGFAFNPAAASAAVLRGEFPETTRSFVFAGGTLANSHFVTIPFNASAPEAALVVANFLMSPEAQLEKQNPEGWGDFTVLDVTRLDAQTRAAFEALDLGPATLAPSDFGQAIPEPHASWGEAIERLWAEHYQG